MFVCYIFLFGQEIVFAGCVELIIALLTYIRDSCIIALKCKNSSNSSMTLRIINSVDLNIKY